MTNSSSETSKKIKNLARETDAGKTPAAPDRDFQHSPKGDAETAAEIGGPKGPEPTRFGDWEQKGRCSDF